MSWENKVIWSEGLFLQPHHLQQQTRYTETLVSHVTRSMAPYPWGVTEFALDDELLKLGKIALKSCAGVTPDGAAFRVPQTDALPPALDVPETVKNCVVYLAVATRRPGAVEITLEEGETSAARYSSEEIELTDVMGRDRRPVTVAIGKLRLQIALDVDDLSDLLTIPVAKIVEVRADNSIVLDRAFIPSVLDIRAAPALSGFVTELEGMINQRAEALAGRINSGGGAKGVADISDFMLLTVCNRVLPQLRHLGGIENFHPEDAFRYFVGLAGELATFLSQDKRAQQFPPYRHDDLTGVFQPVMRALRQYLSAVLEQTAIAIPLEERKYGVRVGVIADKRLLSNATFVMAVKADVAAEQIRRHMPTQAKVGPVESIRQLVNSALPGIGLRPLPVAPRQIPFHAGVVYFELDSDSPFWKQMTTSGGLAIFVPGELPGLNMELWAIRNQ
ncbi:MAG: type VI secretion system baseplate subunit TssK [Pseudomonadota bacterium]